MTSIKSIAAKLFAKYIHQKTQSWAKNPVVTQEKVFRELIEKARNTRFGQDHDFDRINDYKDFAKQVPVRDYEELKPWVEKVVNGEQDVLWPGKPVYFAKTSGTTSGAKYIPITKASMPYHIEAARNAILSYIHETGKADFVNGKMIFLQGSPELDEKNGVKLGRLSGIVAHYVPGYLQKNRMPSWETNCIEDWETKVEAIIDETLPENMTVISGIPSWVQMYFERIQARTGKKVKEVFPNFELFIYGGVNFEPYRKKFESLIGRKVDSIELFPASEGFFAYQDSQKEEGMLLLLNAGIFYEFIRADQFFEENPRRLTIGEVEKDVDYVMIISTNAGLWGYNLGDTVRFTSLDPYRVVVSGRIKHFISAFGEHVIAKEVEQAMKTALDQHGGEVNEFTVAPQVEPENDALPYHEWLIEFGKEPENFDAFARTLDASMQQQNSYYLDLIEGKVLQPLKITSLPEGAFRDYMKSKGKLGGQNKVQRLANDRSVADALHELAAKG
ncbi:GH3 auxin-responsive promoter family protein [Robertkochia aurantiaca]|uniref:GH3 auxin-responsive promoter family protein n=1 Tax=Robertkochia aurantiaca TaxID=2873700 RepID=UPI001CCF60E3|nr:GH3 auxin-responsive promoter family protein [Robertkochia sp. 3YJGBD-33]